MHIENFYAYSTFKKKYFTHRREPFFDIVLKYGRLSSKQSPTIVDIGSGEGDLYIYLKSQGFSNENLHLLDSNPQTVESNKSQLTPNAAHYFAPDKLPFNDGSADIVHTSHLIEYLTPEKLYALMLEMDRVLTPGGCLIISAPMLWSQLYDDLGHLRPYNPMVFHKYFIEMYRNNRLGKVSDNYELKELVYRYAQTPLDEGWSSTVPFLDYLMIAGKRLVGKLGFKKLYRNGYTLVLMKNK